MNDLPLHPLKLQSATRIAQPAAVPPTLLVTAPVMSQSLAPRTAAPTAPAPPKSIADTTMLQVNAWYNDLSKWVRDHQVEAAVIGVSSVLATSAALTYAISKRRHRQKAKTHKQTLPTTTNNISHTIDLHSPLSHASHSPVSSYPPPLAQRKLSTSSVTSLDSLSSSNSRRTTRQRFISDLDSTLQHHGLGGSRLTNGLNRDSLSNRVPTSKKVSLRPTEPAIAEVTDTEQNSASTAGYNPSPASSVSTTPPDQEEHTHTNGYILQHINGSLFDFQTGDELIAMLQSTIQAQQSSNTDSSDNQSADDQQSGLALTDETTKLKQHIVDGHIDEYLMEQDVIKLSVAHWLSIVSSMESDSSASSLLQSPPASVEHTLMFAFNLLSDIDDSALEEDDGSISQQQRFITALRASIAKRLMRHDLLQQVYANAQQIARSSITAASTDAENDTRTHRSRYSLNHHGNVVQNRFSLRKTHRDGFADIVSQISNVEDLNVLIPLSALVGDYQSFIQLCQTYTEATGSLDDLPVDSADVPDFTCLYDLLTHLQQTQWQSLPTYTPADGDNDELTPTVKKLTYSVESMQVRLQGGDRIDWDDKPVDESTKLVQLGSLVLYGLPSVAQSLLLGVSDVSKDHMALAGRAVMLDEETDSQCLQIERYMLDNNNSPVDSNTAPNRMELHGTYTISQQVLNELDAEDADSQQLQTWVYDCKLMITLDDEQQ